MPGRCCSGSGDLPTKPLKQANKIKCPCQKCRKKRACIGVKMINYFHKSLPYRMTARLNCFMEQLCDHLPETVQNGRSLEYAKKSIACFTFAMILVTVILLKLGALFARLLWRFSKMESSPRAEKFLAIGISAALAFGLIVFKLKCPHVQQQSKAADAPKPSTAQSGGTHCDGKEIVPPPDALDCAFLQLPPPCPISDEAGREIFRLAKLYAIPTEMKQPPQLFIYLQNFLTRSTAGIGAAVT